eukprot:CAMPEP_0174914548 /NCGR_PEP_ID=MMETSP0167-20121228/80899_1 /TAXON_ID=38298 /ORGANISM="Rhodella maculata, Strain CCMP736" /LENGTH=92 /DNA_ID=CAMNT_0016159315 /DNA_START=559 /DNA_END=837 /DNA_ORIENTATION=+
MGSASPRHHIQLTTEVSHLIKLKRLDTSTIGHEVPRMHIQMHIATRFPLGMVDFLQRTITILARHREAVRTTRRTINAPAVMAHQYVLIVEE